MNLFEKLIRALFLVKEIVSKVGDLHFRRYRLLQTPWFAIYIHQICNSDEDKDPHDHPWKFESHILSGSYTEDCWNYPDFMHSIKDYYPGDVIKHNAHDAHKLTLLSKEVWTLVITSGRKREWGYKTNVGWINHKEYRQLKNEGKLL